ncbi:MAG: hypothetical protein IKO73_05375 [Bacteroidaceae bacterium]|nr:hypothetical protein [Bacteroidaceae bacterium]
MIAKLLICWIIFDVIIYGAMWLETIYYKKNLPVHFKKILIAFTEED